MSVLIRGMEMPKNCGFCPFCRKTVTEWGSIYSADCIIRKMPIKFSELDLRDGLCPLVELPPHGDLIDRNTAYDSILYGMVMTGYQSRALDCISEYSVPTIIESEGEDG